MRMTVSFILAMFRVSRQWAARLRNASFLRENKSSRPTRARRRKLRIQTRVRLAGYRASPRPCRRSNKLTKVCLGYRLRYSLSNRLQLFNIRHRVELLYISRVDLGQSKFIKTLTGKLCIVSDIGEQR